MYELYAPEIGSYVVQGEYTLVRDQKRRNAELITKTSDGRHPELEEASFKVIKTCTFDDSPDNIAKIELLRVFVEGNFSVILDPKETIGAASYNKADPGSEEAHSLLYEKFALRKLNDVSLPCVAITGAFAHTKYGRYYDVEIRNALLTQIFRLRFLGSRFLSWPAALFRLMPLSRLYCRSRQLTCSSRVCARGDRADVARKGD